jgi:hypothetical protein
MAVSEAASGGLTEYIGHHLTHLTVNQGHGAFWAFHLDSVVFTGGLALLFVFVFGLAARRATSGVPGKLQAAVEIAGGIRRWMVKDTFHGKSKFIAPLAITIFALVFLMNFMDHPAGGLAPLGRRGSSGVEHLRTVATADVNTTSAWPGRFSVDPMGGHYAKGRRCCFSANGSPRPSRARLRRQDSPRLPVNFLHFASSKRRYGPCHCRCGCSATCMPAN